MAKRKRVANVTFVLLNGPLDGALITGTDIPPDIYIARHLSDDSAHWQQYGSVQYPYHYSYLDDSRYIFTGFVTED